MRDVIIGLDIGTTSSKAVVFDLAGAELGQAEYTYRLGAPQPGWAEQDPQEVWQAIVAAIRSAVASVEARAVAPEMSPAIALVGAHAVAPDLSPAVAPDLSPAVALVGAHAVAPDMSPAVAPVHPIALAVASQSGSLVPTRADGTPAYSCITWMDSRSDAQVKQWVSQGAGDLVRRISGWQVHTGLPLATIAWLREHNPAVHAAAERWLCINDWVVHQLSGQFVTNPSNAGVTQLLEVSSQAWSQELCDLCGTNPAQWSAVQASGTPIGPITRRASEETGLPADTLIVNGGHDQSCTALALGVMEPGQVLLACGTSWVISDVVARPFVEHVPAELDVNHHVLPGRWTISQSLGGLGASFEWLVNQCWAQTEGRMERFNRAGEELLGTQPGCNGLVFLPIAGGHAAPAGRQCGGFVNVQLSHTRAQMARAAMEGAACELRLALQQIERSGTDITGLWMFGGATRSAIWPGIVAGMTQLPLRVTHSAHLPAVGAAILASRGAGAYATIREAAWKFSQPASDIQHAPEHTAAYQRVFAEYCAALHKLS